MEQIHASMHITWIYLILSLKYLLSDQISNIYETYIFFMWAGSMYFSVSLKDPCLHIFV